VFTAIACLMFAGCAGVGGDRGLASMLPFSTAKKTQAEKASDGPTTVAEKPNLVKNDRSFLQEIGNSVSRFGPLTLPSSSKQEGNTAALANGHELFQQAMAANGGKRQELFDKAAGEYDKVASRLKKSPYQEDAMFWMGESYFFADRYPKAMNTFGELIKSYPNSRHLDTISKRRFATAQYWLELNDNDGFDLYPNLTNRRRPTVDTFGHAVRMLNRIRFDDPTGKLADDATMAAAIANYKKERFNQANILFDDLRENFPNSEHQFQAHLLQLECKRKVYEGPDYDGSVLDEAENLIKQLVLQFPNESEEKREYLQKVASDIRLRKAQQEYLLAKYYDRRKEYGAARLSYANVAREYSDTNLGSEAEKRLIALGGKPDMPAEKLQWLAELFPERKEAKPLIASDTLGKILR
jgi:outer membrane protein assembly factor BamD (BamD/ComL family)